METIPCTIDEHGALPFHGSKGAAGYDLFAAEPVELFPYRAVKISTGITVALPERTFLMIAPRSGFSFKNQILMPNSIGIIDSDYRGIMSITVIWTPDPVSVMQVEQVTTPAGHINFDLKYRSDAVFTINKHDRIAQAVLVPFVPMIWRPNSVLPPTARGDGGFGSTGIRPGDSTPTT